MKLLQKNKHISAITTKGIVLNNATSVTVIEPDEPEEKTSGRIHIQVGNNKNKDGSRH